MHAAIPAPVRSREAASRRTLAGVLACVLGVAGAGAAGVGVSRLPSPPLEGARPFRFSDAAVPPPPKFEPAGSGCVRIAVAALLSPRRSLAAHGRLFDVLASRLGRRVQIVQRRTYAEVNDLLVEGSALFGFVCSGAFVAAEDRGVELLVAPVVHGTRTYNSYLIARADLPVRSLDDLRGRSFAISDPLSNTGSIYPSFLLAQRGTDAAAFFERVLWTWSHEGSVEAVAHGFADGAAVDSLVYDHLREQDPDLVARTRCFAVSPPLGIPPVVASPRAPPELRARVKDVLLGLPGTEDGRAALERLAIDRFEEARPEDYSEVRAMRAALARRTGK